MLSTLLVPEIIVLWAARQWLAARKLSKKYKDRGWITTHGFFAIMGGFMLYDTEDEPICVLRYSQPRKFILLEATFDNYADFIGGISANEIQDRSHSDGFAKFVAVGQTTWFVVQLLARYAETLPITELEIMTVAFAAMNFIIHLCWWNKPQGVGCPIRTYKQPRSPNRPAAVTSQGTSGQKKSIEGTSGHTDEAFPLMQSFADGRNIIDLRTVWHDPAFSNKNPFSDGPTFSKKKPLRSIKNFYGRTDLTFLPSYPEHSPIQAMFLILLYPPLRSLYALECLIGPIEEDEIAHDMSAKNVSSFERITVLESRHSWDQILAFCAGILFGAIHCIAWIFPFPTVTERMLWRSSSIAVVGTPVLFAACQTLPDWKPPKWLGILVLVFMTTILVIYACARLVLIVQALMALRALPLDAYATIHWTTLIPHI
ncbi:hypothetical protein BT96DRAFT_988230 [Gymnopus androsaceus JB14]|uniref:Uncharacterized protein n=1 Tax=Gymnopus androsaceus JB14 TaxID=1447944 RepID=A0A6A4IAB9_9AGAR|nr:hypothetical protein BT96DRAFT_988230 [Gymnopus androsaceus JB14]